MRVLDLRALRSSPPITRLLSSSAGGGGTAFCGIGGAGRGLPICAAGAGSAASPATAGNASARARIRLRPSAGNDSPPQTGQDLAELHPLSTQSRPITCRLPPGVEELAQAL